MTPIAVRITRLLAVTAILLATVLSGCTQDSDAPSQPADVATDIGSADTVPGEEDAAMDCPSKCDDWLACTDDFCDTATGTCVYKAVLGECTEPIPTNALEVGPYLQWAIQTEATIMWETTERCVGAVLLSKVGDSVWTPHLEGSFETIHEITVSDLTPGTEYAYRIRPCLDDEPVPEQWAFETFPESSDSYVFSVWGDSQDHPEVLSDLAEMMWDDGTRFAVAVGDVVSDGEVKEQWKELLFDSIASFSPYIPFFGAMGNHERNAEWLYKYYHLPEPETRFAFTYGPARFVVINGVTAYSMFDPQGAWLAEETESPEWKEASYRFVFFHEMPITNLWGHDKIDGEPLIRKVLMPQIEDKGVSVLFTGHAHCYERGYLPAGLGMFLVVTGGGGGGLDTVVSGDWPEITVAESKYHYTRVTVTPETAVVTAIALDGSELDTFDVLPGPIE